MRLLWSPRWEQTRSTVPIAGGWWWQEFPQPLQWPPGLFPLSSTRQKIPRFDLCIRDWNIHYTNFRNWHFSKNVGTSQNEDACCVKAVNVPLNQSGSDREAITLEFLTDAGSLLVLQIIYRFIRGVPPTILFIKIISPSPVYCSIKAGLPG